MKPSHEEDPVPARRRGHARPPGGGSAEPVPLHKRTASHFRQGDRQRGAEYFAEGRVHFEIDGARARATVEGTEQLDYAVGLDWTTVPESRALHAFCECQRFSSGSACKHVWATLLALGESGPENQPPGRDRLSLRKDRASSWKDLGVSTDGPPSDIQSSPPGNADKRGSRSRSGRGRSSRRRRRASETTWRSHLAALRTEIGSSNNSASTADASPSTELRVLVNTTASLNSNSLVLDLFERHLDDEGKPGKLRRAMIEPAELTRRLLPDASDNGRPYPAIVAALPADPPPRQSRHRGQRRTKPTRIQRLRLPQSLYHDVLSHLSERGELGWWDGRNLGNLQSLTWDKGDPWQLVLHLDVSGGVVRLRGELERDRESVPLSVPELILPAALDGSSEPLAEDDCESLVFFPGTVPSSAGTVASLDLVPDRDLPWISRLRDLGELVIPREDLEEALTMILELPDLPKLDAPEDFHLSQECSPLQPRLVLKPDPSPAWTNPPLMAELSFDYGSLRVSAGDPRPSIVDWEERKFLRRDMAGEHKALVRLLELDVRPVQSAQGHGLELTPSDLPSVVEPLLQEGWAVEAHGNSLRRPSPPALRVQSGIDWFELDGSVDFDGDEVKLGKVLEAISRGDRFVELKDGAKGILPSAWIETYDSLSKLAHSSTEDGLRFLPSQALLVDALLTAMPPADVDTAFAQLRERLSSFDRIKPKKELKTFGGTLRTYQREGLGWLEFMREFGLGGVLADDMGLGKTVQVLALLQTNRTPGKTTKLPSLVVAPRSLVYNWIDEAAHFTPKLKVIEYGGANREALRSEFGKYDLIVTTYGTLRRDIGFLATVEFDTVILDEAQAIKNAASQTAKASRLLVGRNRLALTGTPIENHLGELGSLFEFLNPGLLGRLPVLDALTSGRNPSQSELALVAAGIRPFILRRTKAEVLPDLPPKTEQVLHCTLRPRQREIYDQLRAVYQDSLLKQVEANGVTGSTIQVLEALLRLRQVACHPGLVNKDWEEAGSAKLEALFDQVSEVLDEGHKVIVFSQFTKLLAYVRRHLDEEQVTYAYLDGQTRNRGDVVERFQTDDSCNLFLISLKAGGLGLNLTAAEYVYLLDPWWNPAVEAQAIDRAHRIGQTQPVFAYRMIASDTVEEKILELQSSKRQIADAILDGKGQTLRDLTADDLRMLLS